MQENLNNQPDEQLSQQTESQSPEHTFTPAALACLNRLKTAGHPPHLFIPGENPADFYSLLTHSFAEYQPVTCLDASLVMDSVMARWHLCRRQRLYLTLETNLYLANPDPDKLLLEKVQQLQFFDRHANSAQLSLRRSIASIQHLRQDSPRDRKWRAQLELKTRSVDLQTNRFNLAKEKDARTADQIAIESKIAARQARDRLKTMEKADQPFPSNEPCMVIDNGTCVIKQTSLIEEENGGDARIWKLTPSNEAIRSMLSKHNAYLIPPQKIVRSFHFHQGRVPMDYQWVQLSVDKEFLAASTIPDPCITLTLTPERWDELAECESVILRYQKR